MPGRNNADADRRQMEGFDSARSDGRHEALRRTQNSIGHVTQKVLTAQLRDMEAKGLLTRRVYAEVPPRVEYTLTPTGYSLRPILDSMVAWGTGYQQQMSGADSAD